MPASDLLPSTSQTSLASATSTNASTGRILTRRNSKKQTLEQVTEEASASTSTTDTQQSQSSSNLMSISNLRKHDAIMEKLKIEGMSQQVAATATLPRKGRTTRSRATRSPSPSASSVVSTSSVMTIASEASTVTSSAVGTKRRTGVTRTASARSTRKTDVAQVEEAEPTHDKTLKADDLDSLVDEKVTNRRSDDHSPTSSVVSVASSVTSGTRTLRRNRKAKEEVDHETEEKISPPAQASVLTRSNSGRNYSLRSKGPKSATNDADDASSVVSSVVSDYDEASALPPQGTRRATRSKSIKGGVEPLYKIEEVASEGTRRSKRSSSKSK
jgi:hypothetical protein